MTPRYQVAQALADALLAGPATAEGFAERVVLALGRKSRWIAPFSRRVFQRFGSELTHPQRRSLIQFIQADAGYRQAWTAPVKPRIRHHFLNAPPMEPRRGALTRCALPALPTPGDLAAWLEIGVSELEWLADPRGMIDSAQGPLCHYHYRWVPKRHGDYRLMEVPKPRLRAIQRKILQEILDPVPAHRAAHGFRREHSCLTFVEPHVGKLVVLRMDLRNFFPSIPAGRVNALFTTLGYPDAAAKRLTGLCTNRVPMRMLLNIPDADPGFRLPWAERRQFADSHLPQGAPTSPALANLCALHLDLRLAALADTLGGTYTRYADDLAFSGDEETRRHAEKLSTLVAAIALEEGFEVNYRKTRVMHRSGRQMLTGIVVNEKTNIRRGEYDSLKAILHNCLRHGPDSQNRVGHRDFRAHLLGRIGHVSSLNPERGNRLQRLFEGIEWKERL